jgi:gentisate 1,2-dioxygenase
MEQSEYKFLDRTGAEAKPVDLISPVVIPKEAIAAEVERLASLPRPANGRRVSYVANPATGVGHGLAHGIAVSISVLLPGERRKPIRHNSSQVNFCIRGGGTTAINGKTIRYEQYDVWNTPPWMVYEDVNDRSELQVQLTYSNSPLLEKMKVHIVEENPEPTGRAKDSGNGRREGRAPDPFGTIGISSDGAQLMTYEKLISPDVIAHKPLHFPWKRVKQELDKLTALGSSYVGRRLYLLYNPATAHTNGTTASFFATMCVRPKNIVDRPHRHVASAINYYFAGKGFSIVEGKRYEWKAGDLMLSAPGWAVHNHASYEEDVYELTIQDSPLNIWMGSLLWQESLDQPIESLGLTGGFSTNREAEAIPAG